MEYARCFGVFLSAALLAGCGDTDKDTGAVEQNESGSPPVLAAQIEVELDRTAMVRYGLTPADVDSAIDEFISTRRVFAAEDIKDISILSRHFDTPIKLGTVASVRVNLSKKKDDLREESAR